MKNSLKLRTWRNKIGRDTKIQERRAQWGDPLFSFFPIPFLENWTNPYEKSQAKMSGRGDDAQARRIRKQGYADYNFTQVVQPLHLIYAKEKGSRKLKELSETVKYAFEQGLKMKAVGTGHSYSDIATTNDCLMLTDELNTVLKDDRGPNGTRIAHDKYLDTNAPLVTKIRNSWFSSNKAEQRYLYEFESGIKIYELNESLEKDKLALDNMGTYQGQSFIGAASTGTHGSGITLGALPEMIRSICIVSEGGLVFRIEPKTDYLIKKGWPIRRVPKLGQKDLPEGAKTSLKELIDRGDLTLSSESRDVYLIQNDEWFNAAKLNVGCFGIVYSLIIEVGNYHDIIETIEFTTWNDLKKRLNAKDPELFVSKNIDGLQGENILNGIETDANGVHKIRHMEILVNPYPDDKNGTDTGERFCRVTRRYRSFNTMDLTECMKRGRVPSNTKAWVARGRINTIAEGATVKKNREINFFLNNSVIFRAAHAVRKPNDGRTKTLIKLATNPGGYIPVEHMADHHWNDEYHYRNRNWHVFPAGGDKIGGYGAEMALSFGKRPGNNNREFINAVDRLLEIAAMALKEGSHAQTVPYSLRFVAPSQAHLSPQYSEDHTPTCMIELLNVYDTVGGKEMLRRYQLAMLEMGGKPHWGLDMNVMSGKYLEKGLYPKHKAWKKVYDVLNAYGTFDNAFTHRMGWSI